MANDFSKKVHLVGIVSLVVAIVANFIPVAYLAVVYDIMPKTSEILGI